MTTPRKYYREIIVGEIMEATDVFINYSGVPVLLPRSDVGNPRQAAHYNMLRPVQVDEWVAVKDRLPTEVDGDVNGEVSVLGVDGEAFIEDVAGVDVVAYSYWRSITPPVEIEPAIVIKADGNDRKVEFLDNGDVRVGCTTVPAKVMDAIEARRKNERKS